ncbi:CorA metal ion transporter [Ciborinia camelliae]|nr:CorA metal ion transporter [Ciborinia camelliae]
MSAPLPPPRTTEPISSTTRTPPPRRPELTAIQPPQNNVNDPSTISTPNIGNSKNVSKKKRNNHRGGKKKRPRRQSFAASTEDGTGLGETSMAQRVAQPPSATRSSFYRGRNLSTTSIESEELLDHRDHQSMRPRRPSTMGQNAFGQIYDSPSFRRPSYNNPFKSAESVTRRPATGKSKSNSEDEAREEESDERTPLISGSSKSKSSNAVLQQGKRSRRNSSRSSGHSKKRTIFEKTTSGLARQQDGEYNVNYPPSVPGSPVLGATNRDMSFGDVMVRDHSPERMSMHTGSMRSFRSLPEEACEDDSVPGSPRKGSSYGERRHTIALQAEEDVCFPVDMSEMAEEDIPQRNDGAYRQNDAPRRHKRKFPDLSFLDDWSRFEKEGRSEERRAKKITEPQLIGGRLRPIHKGWHRAEDDAPYRFTYFNEEFPSTIHSQTISELVQPGGSFKELFVPDRPVLDDSSDSETEGEADDMDIRRESVFLRHATGQNNGDSLSETRQSSIIDMANQESKRSDPGRMGRNFESHSRQTSKEASPNKSPNKSPSPKNPPPNDEKPKRYGDRPTWWLDVLSPTDAEMKVISKTFGIHPLTAEDILMQEAREKVELFRHYYFVNYRSFEQDMNNENFLEPVNMYVVVFREGVISFHFSQTPHPANVRRRIRQLKDYLILTADWISYAIIDDITDVFAPLIQTIEDEVDDIDDAILKLHSPAENEKSNRDSDKKSEAGDGTSGESGGDMLRRVGDCRKKVMGLYRLLGNKADVIKGFAKRCNEQWEIAPRSEIGLYLGDIQDHIVTMTGNLSHYEKILARSHGNYLAQINIRMNERQEQTADVLGKLTVLGTIVLPMNIITGLWGMNVWVPGQEYEGNLTWFWCITAGLLAFGLACFYIAKMAYKIV